MNEEKFESVHLLSFSRVQSDSRKMHRFSVAARSFCSPTSEQMCGKLLCVVNFDAEAECAETLFHMLCFSIASAASTAHVLLGQTHDM